ncbi:MAG: ATP-dependent zinc metalloprotease FtsH [Lachnospiraceae bacterium]|nr:ATP-dependent zinc metalloprotease FtsH [Lachnospiraceae bacterium]MBP3506018.1 ATP-dependent zinc metalloprotease FtsH [Lachnospiraceae bacterium]
MNKQGAAFRGILWFLFLLAIIVFAYSFWVRSTSLDLYSYNLSSFQKDLEEGNITTVTIKQNSEVPTGMVKVITTDNKEQDFYASDVNDVIHMVQDQNTSEEQDIVLTISDVQRPSTFSQILPYVLLLIVMVVFMFIMMMAMQGSGGGKMMDFGKSRAKMMVENDHGIDFTKVAGLQEEKQELEEIVDFLQNPGKYGKLGARIPKGVLLVGPPGTGKTLLAKAISGEANVPFLSISGSDFVEMFVGVGASRVRDLFEEAKKNAPCIVFIDEIDAVARKRGSGLGGGHDEREQTLNQLLVEMDGFGVNEGIIVMAATNRVDILDPAILRPGRFDRKVVVGRPDVKGREEILKVHTVNKPLGDDVDLHEIARTTSGFAGADLENLMNEAAILAAKRSNSYIQKKDIDQAFIKVGVGTEKKSRLVPEKTRKITAYHEAGHAILYHVLPDVGPVYAVSIIPTGEGAAGYTMRLPNNDNEFTTKGMMRQDIMVDFGGRIAEELIFEDITTGASQDIKVATQTARSMVTKYGMSEKLGLINYESSDEEEVFLGRDLGHAKSFSEETATLIDTEVKRIMDECYAEAKQILVSHMDILHRCAELLLEKDRIDGKEFEQLFA